MVYLNKKARVWVSSSKTLNSRGWESVAKDHGTPSWNAAFGRRFSFRSPPPFICHLPLIHWHLRGVDMPRRVEAYEDPITGTVYKTAQEAAAAENKLSRKKLAELKRRIKAGKFWLPQVGEYIYTRT